MPVHCSLSRRQVLLGTAATALLVPPGVHAQTPPAPPRFDPTRRTGPTLWEHGHPSYRLSQQALTERRSGRSYRLWQAMPRVPPAGGADLVCLLDGNAVADTLQASDLDRLAASPRPPLLMAIASDNALRFDTTRRAYDYTPPVTPEGVTWDDEARGRPGGGADHFLRFLSEQVLPAAASAFPLHPSRRALWGHSYGGLFVLHALFRQPALFTHYAAADPSLWWHEGFMLRAAEQAAPIPAGHRASLLWMDGDRIASADRPAPAGVDAQARDAARQRRASLPPDSSERLAQRLARRAGLSVTYRRFAGLSHGAMFGASLPPALDFFAQATAPAR